jgi:nucleotidyltransferase substrate binding protein (TIGR01987 family)
MEHTKERFSAQVTQLAQALGTLEDALQQPLTTLTRDATIQRFEYVFELSWKAIKAAGAYLGKMCSTPREAIRFAYQQEWIEDTEPWFDALDARNLTVHTYSEQLANRVYEVAKGMPACVQGLLKALQQL